MNEADKKEHALLHVEIIRRFDDGEVIVKIPGWKERVQVKDIHLYRFRWGVTPLTEQELCDMYCEVADNLPPLEECTEDAIIDEINRWLDCNVE